MADSLPPGLQGSAKKFVAGGHPKYDSFEWMPFENTKSFTNVFIWDKKTGKVCKSQSQVVYCQWCTKLCPMFRFYLGSKSEGSGWDCVFS